MEKKLNPKVKAMAEKAHGLQHQRFAEEKDKWLKTWNEHATNKSMIVSFSTVIGDKLYLVNEEKDQQLVATAEYHGDHSENWIVGIHPDTGEELFRKNTKYVDMIHWKLSSSQTDSK